LHPAAGLDSDQSGEHEPTTVLSERQAEVWALKDSGLSHPAVGDELGISTSTVANTWQQAKANRERAARSVEVLADPEEIVAVR
jgi:DNA-binding NarL/FixJ family response regulator